MATKKDLRYALERIADLIGGATTQEQAIERGLDRYLWLEYDSIYGGYRVVFVGVKNGAHYGALGMSSIEPRMKASDMLRKLEVIEFGLEYAKRVQA